MKTQMHFNSIEEMQNYFPDGVPSTVIALVGDNEAIFTTSNNFAAQGVPVQQGGVMMNEETSEEYIAMQKEIEDATEITNDIKEG